MLLNHRKKGFYKIRACCNILSEFNQRCWNQHYKIWALNFIHKKRGCKKMTMHATLKICVLCAGVYTIYPLTKSKNCGPKCKKLWVPWELACRGICERYRSENKRYGQGVKRCTCCDAYLEYGGIQCPCCRTHLRVKRKSKWLSDLWNNLMFLFNTVNLVQRIKIPYPTSIIFLLDCQV